MIIDGGNIACFAVPSGRSYIKPFINLLLYDAFRACPHMSCGRTAGTVSLEFHDGNAPINKRLHAVAQLK